MRRALVLLVVLAAWWARPALAQLPTKLPTTPDEQGKLLPRYVAFAIESTPLGASIHTLDGDYLGKTPARCNLDPRTSHNLILQLPGYDEREVHIPIGQIRPPVFALAPDTLTTILSYNFRYRPALAYPILALLLGGLAAGGMGLRRRFRRLHQKLTDAELENPSLIGRVIGDYRVERLLGEGAFSQVFEVEHVQYHDRFALKLLKPDFLEADFRARFHREMGVGRDLNHSNLVHVFAYGEYREAPYMVMELLAGRTMEAWMKERGRMRPAEALRIFVQIGSGLAAAHERGIVHRDVKPENVMLTPSGDVRIMDFGIAKLIDGQKLTATGAALGTPRYMSPEHLNSKTIDARADVYSMGVILYQMLAGQAPFTGEDTIAVIAGHLRKKPPPLRSLAPEVSPELEAVVMKMLEKKPERRYQTMTAVLAALETPVA